MHTRRCTKNRGNQPRKCAITCEKVPKESQATDEEIRQRKIQLDSLENENEKLENITRNG